MFVAMLGILGLLTTPIISMKAFLRKCLTITDILIPIRGGQQLLGDWTMQCLGLTAPSLPKFAFWLISLCCWSWGGE